MVLPRGLVLTGSEFAAAVSLNVFNILITTFVLMLQNFFRRNLDLTKIQILINRLVDSKTVYCFLVVSA